MLHIDIKACNLFIEHALRDFQFRRFLAHGVEQGIKLHLHHGHDIVLEEESANRYETNRDNQRTHNVDKRDAGGLHREQFQAFAQVSERHQRSQQNRQRKCHRHKEQGGIEEHFRQHRDAQTFSHHIVDVAPKELHQDDKQTDSERHQEQRQEGLQHERI